MGDAQTQGGQLGDQDVQAVDELKAAYERINQELSRVIVGQEEVIRQLLVALFSGGHCILEGVPGLAKTLMISTLAEALELSVPTVKRDLRFANAWLRTELERVP